MKRIARRLAFILAPTCASLVAWAATLGACSSSSSPPSSSSSGGASSTHAASSDSSASASSGGSSSDAGPDADAGGDADASDAGPCPSDGSIPGDLFCTGLYSDWSTKTIDPSARAYAPGLVLWSDGADKQRWIHLPPGSTIDTSDMDDWVFPDGTKIWKQFSLNGAIIETRLIWKNAGAWRFVDYRWSADGTSAQSLTKGEKNVAGTTFEIPSINECYACHDGRKDYVLGFDLLGVGVSSAKGLTLSDLVAQGLLTDPPPATTIAIPEDGTNKAAQALGWLHVNCGATCHNATLNAGAAQTHLYTKLLAAELYTDGGPGTVADLDTYITSVNVTANFLVGNQTPYMRIAPGDSAHSLMPLFSAARDPDAGGFLPMPPIISHIADTASVDELNAWIDALK